MQSLVLSQMDNFLTFFGLASFPEFRRVCCILQGSVDESPCIEVRDPVVSSWSWHRRVNVRKFLCAVSLVWIILNFVGSLHVININTFGRHFEVQLLLLHCVHFAWFLRGITSPVAPCRPTCSEVNLSRDAQLAACGRMMSDHFLTAQDYRKSCCTNNPLQTGQFSKKNLCFQEVISDLKKIDLVLTWRACHVYHLSPDWFVWGFFAGC